MSYKTHKKYLKGVFKTKAEIEEEIRATGVKKIYYGLSFGAGTQSTHLLEQHFQGKIHYDYIVWADTGAEPQFIHDQVMWWKKRQEEVGNTTPFFIVNEKKMDKGLEEMLFRYFFTDYQRFQLPVWFSKIENGVEKPIGMCGRQCTTDFKIRPVQMKLREVIMSDHYNMDPSKRKFPMKKAAIIMDIGFSSDEIGRVERYKSDLYKYVYLAYPLIEQDLDTTHSINFLKERNFPDKRSRCYLCPFQNDKKEGMEWLEIIKHEPISFLKACWLDEKLRYTCKTGLKNLHSIPYFHHTRKPLKIVYADIYMELNKKYRPDILAWEKEWYAFIRDKWIFGEGA